jgi:hypothetical protein
MHSEKIERIKTEFIRDQVTGQMAVAAGDIPGSYDAITAEWLGAILCRDVPGAKVLSHSLSTVDDGTSNRRRIFIEYNSVGRAAALPASVFCKATHSLAHRMLASSGSAHSEDTFYNRIRPLLAIEAPEAYFAAYDPVKYTSIIVLRDLRGEAEFCSDHTQMDKARAANQMEVLATLHARFFESPELDGLLADLAVWPERFMRNVKYLEFERICGAGFAAAEAVIPPALFRRSSDVWPATLRSVERQRTLPRTVTHCDVHLKNWYIINSGSMGLGDWQVTSKGHWARDVAYALGTALSVDSRRAWERELIAFYLEKLREQGGPAQDFDEAWKNYRQQMMTALAYWTLTLTPAESMPDMQPRDITIEFIRRLAHAVDDLGSLDSFD